MGEVVEQEIVHLILGEFSQAETLLDSGIYLKPSAREEDLWVTNAQ